MKRLIACAIALLTFVTLSFAVPATPYPVKYVQPDGSVIMLRIHGDEYFHWITDDATGQVIALQEDGFYRPSTIDYEMRERALERRRRGIALRGTQNGDPMTHGERHIPAILVQFSDVKFSISSPQQQFNNLLNQAGYSANGATGSVRDFYYDNSRGEFTPVFDVYAPVTLSKTCEYYGTDGTEKGDRAYEALADAVNILNSRVDFSKYDYDDDGYVDMILMFFAGHNQAETGKVETIWPHQSYARTRTPFDGKYLGRYFCTSELKGTGSQMCGIGTTCHEFAHSLGLPDFYDTDYEKNGEDNGLSVFSTMCSGCYNNESRTPPYFNSEERILLGWMSVSDVKEISAGANQIGPIHEDIAYRSPSGTEGEYFLFEYRDKTGWDEALPSGLTVYHVDKSSDHIVGGITAFQQWEYWEYYNTINAYGEHPCFYIVAASDPQNLNFKDGWQRMVFPGSIGVTTFRPIRWDGLTTGLFVSGIKENSGSVSFKAYISEPGGDPNEPIKANLSWLGYAYIDVEKMEVVTAVGDEPSSVQWKQGDGDTVTAIITYPDGRREELSAQVPQRSQHASYGGTYQQAERQ